MEFPFDVYACWIEMGIEAATRTRRRLKFRLMRVRCVVGEYLWRWTSNPSIWQKFVSGVKNGRRVNECKLGAFHRYASARFVAPMCRHARNTCALSLGFRASPAWTLGPAAHLGVRGAITYDTISCKYRPPYPRCGSGVSVTPENFRSCVHF